MNYLNSPTSDEASLAYCRAIAILPRNRSGHTYRFASHTLHTTHCPRRWANQTQEFHKSVAAIEGRTVLFCIPQDRRSQALQVSKKCECYAILLRIHHWQKRLKQTRVRHEFQQCTCTSPTVKEFDNARLLQRSFSKGEEVKMSYVVAMATATSTATAMAN